MTRTVTKAKLGKIEFVAQSCTGGETPRRISRHGAIGVSGQYLEDLGEDARQDTFRATLSEEDWLALDNLRRKGEVIDVVHPLYGVYRGRIVQCPYEAGLQHMVDTTIMVIEDGEHKTQLTLTSKSVAQAAASASSIFDDLPAVGDLGELPEATFDDLSDAWTDLGTAWTGFDLELTKLAGGSGSWRAVGGAFDVLGDAISGVLDIVDEIQDAASDTILEMQDGLYSLAAAARDVVDAARGTLADAWHSIDPGGPRLISGLLEEYLGVANEDTLDLFYEANPHIIDALVLPAGVAVVMPIIA